MSLLIATIINVIANVAHIATNSRIRLYSFGDEITVFISAIQRQIGSLGGNVLNKHVLIALINEIKFRGFPSVKFALRN